MHLPSFSVQIPWKLIYRKRIFSMISNSEYNNKKKNLIKKHFLFKLSYYVGNPYASVQFISIRDSGVNGRYVRFSFCACELFGLYELFSRKSTGRRLETRIEFWLKTFFLDPCFVIVYVVKFDTFNVWRFIAVQK